MRMNRLSSTREFKKRELEGTMLIMKEAIGVRVDIEEDKKKKQKKKKALDRADATMSGKKRGRKVESNRSSLVTLRNVPKHLRM